MSLNQTAVRPIDKVKACILYACSKDDHANAKLDHIRLNKVLWYSDAASFMATGTPITGTRYVRKPHGPVAKSMSAATDELMKSGLIRRGKRFDPTRGAWVDSYEYIGVDNGSVDSETVELTEVEKATIDRAFRGACVEHDTSSISERTHGEIWELAQNGEEIPLFLMFAERLGRITKSHVDMAFGA
jgi:hypothetical protein